MDGIAQLINLVFNILPYAVTAASALCAITKTPTSGDSLEKAYKILDVIALNVGHAKEKSK